MPRAARFWKAVWLVLILNFWVGFNMTALSIPFSLPLVWLLVFTVIGYQALYDLFFSE